MIVYGVVADVSIAKLFIAGVVPGLVLIVMLMSTVAIRSLLSPAKTPAAGEALPLGERIRRTRHLAPVVGLILAVLGSIYGGYATPTEAAALGVVGALILSAWSGMLTWQTFLDSIAGATRTSCMIGFIIATAAFLSVAMAYSGIPRLFAEDVAAMHLSRLGLLTALTLLFIVLGCFLEGTSLIVLTGAVIMPLVHKAGIDPLWFGIYLIVILEISLVTPPVGINLFVLQGMTGKSLGFVASASFPYFLVLIAFLLLIVIFPQIVLFLPNLTS
jgi:tripartite ATP-independent transporter DctM subunit